MPVGHVAEQTAAVVTLTSKLCEAYGASRSESEPDSASENEIVGGQSASEDEASTNGEDTGECSRSAHRGGWGQRVPRERCKEPERSDVSGSCPGATPEIHNW